MDTSGSLAMVMRTSGQTLSPQETPKIALLHRTLRALAMVSVTSFLSPTQEKLTWLGSYPWSSKCPVVFITISTSCTLTLEATTPSSCLCFKAAAVSSGRLCATKHTRSRMPSRLGRARVPGPSRRPGYVSPFTRADIYEIGEGGGVCSLLVLLLLPFKRWSIRRPERKKWEVSLGVSAGNRRFCQVFLQADGAGRDGKGGFKFGRDGKERAGRFLGRAGRSGSKCSTGRAGPSRGNVTGISRFPVTYSRGKESQDGT